MIVGERVNTQGSRKIKEFVLNDDYDGVLGSPATRWSTAHTPSTSAWRSPSGATRPTRWRSCQEAAMGVEVPLMIDTLETRRAEAALEHVPRPGDRQLHQHGERPRRIESTCPWRRSTAPPWSR